MKEISRIDTNSYFSGDVFIHDLKFQNNKKLYNIPLAPVAIATRNTIFDFISPIIYISRLFHLVPLNFLPESNIAKFKIISWPVMGNVSFAAIQCVLLHIIQDKVREFYEVILHGTELYTFTYQTITVFTVTLAVVVLSVIRAKHFEKGWNSLMTLAEEMNITETVQLEELNSVKKWLWIKLLHTMVITLAYLSFAAYLTSQLCSRSPLCSEYPYTTAFCLFSNAVAVAIMLIFGILFSTICNTIRPLFLQVHEEMGILFKDPPFYSKNLTYKIVEHYRVLHARICDTVGYFEGFFGLQALFLLCSGCFTITMGVYSNIHYFSNLADIQAVRIVTLWGLQALAAVVTMGYILTSAEYLTYSARCTTRILNRVHHVNVDGRISKQVLLFNIKLGHFPLKISAFHITTISASFLATAITNIVTYVLVLFQFNLSIEEEQPFRNNSLIQLKA